MTFHKSTNNRQERILINDYSLCENIHIYIYIYIYIYILVAGIDYFFLSRLI